MNQVLEGKQHTNITHRNTLKWMCHEDGVRKGCHSPGEKVGTEGCGSIDQWVSSPIDRARSSGHSFAGGWLQIELCSAYLKKAMRKISLVFYHSVWGHFKGPTRSWILWPVKSAYLFIQGGEPEVRGIRKAPHTARYSVHACSPRHDLKMTWSKLGQFRNR